MTTPPANDLVLTRERRTPTMGTLLPIRGARRVQREVSRSTIELQNASPRQTSDSNLTGAIDYK